MMWNVDGLCSRTNPYTGNCTCLSGTEPDIGFVHPNNNQTATVLCYGQQPGAFHGAYLLHRGGKGCLTPNKFTGACSCPTSTTTSEDYNPFNDTNYLVTFCYGASSSIYFGGVYGRFPGGGNASCGANPFVANKDQPCGCPAEYSQAVFADWQSICTFGCSMATDNATCSLFGEFACGWCPKVNSSSSAGTCFTTAGYYNGVPEQCCSNGGVYSTCAPDDGEFWTCCSEPGSFCCSGYDVPFAQCCGPSYCGPNETPQCGDVENAWCQCD